MNSRRHSPTLLEAALDTASIGLRVHPLIGKHPVLNDWPARAVNDREVISAWLSVPGRNYGIICDKIAVIDTDTEDLSAWWIDNMTPTPWSVRTPRGGRHFYYRSRPGLRNAVKAHRGWDVRAGGRGYVVGFGSSVNGRRYELIGHTTLELPPFDPSWLPPDSLEACHLSPQRNLSARPEIQNLRAYIGRIMSIQGSRGSDACFRVACVLRDQGKTPAETLEYMREWNEHCAVPPWSVPELEKKVRDAFSRLAKGG